MENSKSTYRTKKTIINTVVDFFVYIMIAILKFVVRTIFIMTIGIELLGLNSLFASVMTVFSLPELGFATAVGSLLYKPIAEDDTEKIKSIINLTKKIFLVVGIIVIACGCIVTPFIHLLIKDNKIPIGNIRIYFMLFTIFSAISYFNMHKSVLIGADQKKYVEKKFIIIFQTCTSLFQIGSLLIFKNFSLFLIIQIVFIIIQNIAVSHTANKMYPYLKEKKVKPLLKTEKKELLKKVVALGSYKVGGIIIATTDNLLMSIFFGVEMIGLYSNYALIITSITLAAYQLVGGMTASVGNLWATENNEKVYEVFKIVNFLQYWLCVFCSTCLLVLIEPFITLWLGDKYLLGIWLLVILVGNFYFSNMRNATNIFKEGKGLFWQDRFKPLFEALINLGMSLLFLHFFGFIGIFMGTAMSLIFVGTWVEPKVLYKYGFNMSSKKFFVEYILRFLLCVAILCLMYFICSYLPAGIGMFFIKIIICLILPNLILFLIFFKTKEFKYFTNLAKRIFTSRKNKSTE